MKLNINNKANLPFEVIGRVYDKYLNYPYEDTLYENKVEYELFEYKKKDYKMTIQYKINCVSITIEELEVFTKKVSMKGVRFPRIPKKKN